jgi:drug/metabolite transporter (DMT)-like permease
MSWRTTTAGIAAIVVAIATAVGALFDADPLTLPDWGAVAAAIMAGVGLLAARDNKVSSEQAGAK